MTNQEWKKKFQRRFGIFWSKVQSGNIIGYVDPNDNRPIIIYQDSVFAFLQSEIDLALANRNKEIVEMIKKVQSVEPASNGRYNACTELYHLITNKS